MWLILLHLKARLLLLHWLLRMLVLGEYMMLECRLGLWSWRLVLWLELLKLLKLLQVL
jgi:hypothetical protein